MKVTDICIIGSGIASTLTLIEICNKLLNDVPLTKKVSIAIIEKNKEFYKGIPYGARSSVNALTITSVHDFLNENESPLFYEWLLATKDTWTTFYKQHGGITAARWLKENMPLIENKKWETVYVPRFLYGNYLSEKITNLLKAVEEKQLAEFRFIQAEAIDSNVLANGQHEVTLEHPDDSSSKMTTNKLVIATGSAPVKKVDEVFSNKVLFVNDIYEPSVNDNLITLQATLSNTTIAENRNVLIIGSNASSIELLYLFEGLPELRVLVNKTVIISTSGILPYHITTKVLDNYHLPNLDEVRANGNYTIQTLVDAATKDLKYAVQDGANMNYVGALISNTLKLMEALDEDARKAFFGIHGIKLRDMFRRSGPEYKGASDALIALDEVTVFKGRYLQTVPTDNGVTMTYLDTVTGEQKTYPLTFNAIINCSGSHHLDKSQSRLLYNFVNKNICRMNLSNVGFEVNEKFEAAPNLYIMGPLLGGNVNKLIHFWQLENAARLTYLAPYLACELLNIS